jgi:phosphoglycerate dehydrogenase-like enzyme
MRVIGYDPYAGTDPHESVDALEKGLSQADIVTLHIPLGETSKMMLDRERLAKMKPGAVLINCARGGIVDERALLDALERDHIAMYGTDVFETEPVVAADPLLARTDVIATLHTAAMTTESKRAMSVQAAENILAALDGKVDPTVLINRKELGL